MDVPRRVLRQSEQFAYRLGIDAGNPEADPVSDQFKGIEMGLASPSSGGGGGGGGGSAGGGGTPGTPAGAAGGPASVVNPGGGGVPLVQKPDGSWTSSDPAWAQLINRESGGRNIIQSPSTHDVNSGGNEAFGLFQITPGTWASHGGQGSVYNSTPQQQAEVAARILRNNPSGSDWGAGMAGREDAGALMRGLGGATTPATLTTPKTPTPPMGA